MAGCGMSDRRLRAGFTLIELMIVIVIIGILAAIAYPSYIKYVRDSQRADAKAALMDAGQRLEGCYTQNSSYELDECPSVDTPLTIAQGYWKIDVAVHGDGQGYTLTAEKTEKGVTDRTCSGTMTLDQTGRRQPADDCW